MAGFSGGNVNATPRVAIPFPGVELRCHSVGRPVPTERQEEQQCPELLTLAWLHS